MIKGQINLNIWNSYYENIAEVELPTALNWNQSHYIIWNGHMQPLCYKNINSRNKCNVMILSITMYGVWSWKWIINCKVEQDWDNRGELHEEKMWVSWMNTVVMDIKIKMVIVKWLRQRESGICEGECRQWWGKKTLSVEILEQ